MNETQMEPQDPAILFSENRRLLRENKDLKVKLKSAEIRLEQAEARAVELSSLAARLRAALERLIEASKNGANLERYMGGESGDEIDALWKQAELALGQPANATQPAERGQE